MKLLNIFIISLCLNCFLVPNNQSSRDFCKEGTSLKTGKKYDRDVICSFSLINSKKAEDQNNQQMKDSALANCLLALEELKKCDKEENIKFSLTNPAQN
ncbi:hypothetical protein JWG41_04685 [Leptospira sp. 201903075]|uniref:hypothetical protein n=1 Tax=Leptospira chreensis TaxID=2810035 RepID=UPI0019641A8B|nr:hypothetical protein [Leptospira chreensis]MBM9589728.1 hypothetical protein [Leptospira chreensis]